ncbi:hypothetical protein [Streptomyces sp. RerS4]|uniref:hypothetical protein n=1 Tax=Streptomyces sp. RerS4 TaxID=2942449 RepID=UPI00201BB4EA|nr:hypothetical protein [Streptomyces sp. RerS4]UQW99294.1 hypothetical protein M4D82_01185 [Streptomyces sp. RerS4]
MTACRAPAPQEVVAQAEPAEAELRSNGYEVWVEKKWWKIVELYCKIRVPWIRNVNSSAGAPPTSVWMPRVRASIAVGISVASWKSAVLRAHHSSGGSRHRTRNAVGLFSLWFDH